MAKKVISLAFTYANKETKNCHIYNLADEHQFWPKKIYISKNDVKEAAKKITLNIILEV